MTEANTAANPAKTKALELAIQFAGTPEEVVKRAHAYHSFLTGAAATATAKVTPPATGAAPPPADKKAADKPAADKKAAEKVSAPTGKGNGAAAPKANGAAAPKANGAAAPKNPPSAQSIAADTKAPGGTNSYADVVAMLHKVQNSPAGRPECFKILLEDGGGAKSVRDLKPAHYDSVVEACNNVISDEGESGGTSGEDELGDLDAVAGGPERDEMGLS